MKSILLQCISFLMGASLTLGFSVPSVHVIQESVSAFTSSPLLLSGVLPSDMDPETAKTQFFFYLFAGSGAGGIGIAQVPRISSELMSIRALEGEGPSAGGETISMGLASVLFPTLYVKDVQKAIQKVPSCQQISKQGRSTSYMASRGYIARDDFVLSLKGCNPLAAYALYEALCKGSGAVCAPNVVEEGLTRYRVNDGVQEFTSDLQSSTLTKLSAYGALAFLLFVTFTLIIETGIAAFL